MTNIRPHVRDGEFVHEALLYHGGEDRRTAIGHFAQEAREAGEPLLVAMPSDDLARLRGQLTRTGGDVEFAEIESVAANPACLLPVIDDWIDEHVPAGRARIICESVWPGRELPETVESLRQEDVFNRALAGRAATLLCPYDADGLSPLALEGAQRTHPFLIEAGARRRSATYRAPDAHDPDERWPLDPAPREAVRYQLEDDLRRFRDAIGTDPRLDGLPGPQRQDLVLAANEAAINAVQHGDGACSAVVWSDDDRVVVEIRAGTAVPNLLAGCRRPDPAAPSGRGLWLINQVCDLVQARSGPAGTTMRMHVRRPSA